MGNVRVRGHNYHGKGYYFITFGTFNRRHLLSRIENGQVVLEPAGELLLKAWRKIAVEDPAYELGATAVMPDHFHGLVIARRSPKVVIGKHVSRVEGRVLHAMRKQLGDPELKIWDDGFYDYLSLDLEMLKAFEAYIGDNPMRWQLRKDHPEWFKKQYAIKHDRLPNDTTWTAYGDATLLDYPRLVPVVISRKISDEERAKQVAEIVAQVADGAIPIGGFISPGEQEVAAQVMALPRARLIKLEPWGLKRYKPSGARATRWLATGRTLVLTGFPDDELVECRRENCLKNNEWVRVIAEESRGTSDPPELEIRGTSAPAELESHGTSAVPELGWLEDYNVVWGSPSRDSSESMPCGGHDIGLNVWVEDGDLLFYIDRTGNFDENNQALKTGRARIHMEPNPFGDGQPFRQELKLREGYVEIHAGKPEVTVAVWVDVFQPVIRVDVRSEQPLKVKATYENWRMEKRLMPVDKRHGCLSYIGYQGDVFTYPDVIEPSDDGVVFYHRNNNADLVRDKLIEQQKLSAVSERIPDTQCNRTFGGVMRGDGMVEAGVCEGKYLEIPFTGCSIETPEPVIEQRIEWVLHTEQAETVEQWRDGLSTSVENSNAQSSQEPSLNWWSKFWNRSHIIIEPDAEPTSPAWQVGRNYQLFRYMLGTNAFGEYPTKFNGALFTVDPRYAIGDYKDEFTTEVNHDNETPDFRQWGGGSFTSQNQRLVYWPMLKSGDFDMMQCQFNYFKRALPAALARVENYWGHNGACFAEQLENFGLPIGWGYGWPGDPDKYHQREDGLEDGVEGGMWVRYYYESQIEWTYMIIRYYKFSGADISAWIPFMKQSIQFYDEHYRMRCKQQTGKEFTEDGKYIFAPTKPLETYKSSVNPLPIIVGLKTVLPELLALNDYLDDTLINDEDCALWTRMLECLPEIPTAEVDGKTIYSPAAEFDPVKINQEDPQMYGVFPYPLARIGNDTEMEIARNTWKYDPLKVHFKCCWGQSEIWAAKLGEVADAKDLIVDKLADSERRFPAFWGPGPDWVPDVDHGGAGMIGLQEMLMQTDGDDINLFPAWPKEWDVDFKLWAPSGVVEASMRDGDVSERKRTE